jgi:hypothetical protein
MISERMFESRNVVRNDSSVITHPTVLSVQEVGWSQLVNLAVHVFIGLLHSGLVVEVG